MINSSRSEDPLRHESRRALSIDLTSTPSLLRRARVANQSARSTFGSSFTLRTWAGTRPVFARPVRRSTGATPAPEPNCPNWILNSTPPPPAKTQSKPAGGTLKNCVLSVLYDNEFTSRPAYLSPRIQILSQFVVYVQLQNFACCIFPKQSYERFAAIAAACGIFPLQHQTN